MLADVDLILIMTVNPPVTVVKALSRPCSKKIKKCRQMIGDLPLNCKWMGGVAVSNISHLAQAGANNFVAGSAIFHADDPNLYIKKMRSQWLEN